MNAIRRIAATTLAIAAFSLQTPATATADDLHVPSEYATIQSAIDAASAGDAVIVAPGVYNEALNLLGKEITLRSAAGADVTTLDGTGLMVSILTATSGETFQTVVEGFTFRDGRGTQAANCITANGWVGGAIYVRNSRLTVRACAFVENGVSLGYEMTAGGAIYARDADLRISECEFLGNGGFGNTGDGIHSGGAVYACADSRLDVDACLFDGNGPAGHGGGLNIVSGDLNLTNTTFTNNNGSHGGGLRIVCTSNSNHAVQDCHFEGNVSSHGGGLRASCEGALTVERCTFVRNRASFGGGFNADAGQSGLATFTAVDVIDNDGGFGGGIVGSASESGELTISEAVVAENVASAACCNTGIYSSECFVDGLGNNSYWGGGADLRTFYGGRISVYNALFDNNSASNGGGIHAAACGGGVIDIGASTVVRNGPSGLHLRNGGAASVGGASGVISASNLVVAENVNQIRVTLRDTTVAPAVTYSNVAGGHVGAGNIDADPGFVNAAGGDFRLAGGSACIDAGTNATLPPSITTDLAGNARYVDDPATADTGAGTAPLIDMGAFEFQASGGCPADLDGDGVVSINDLALLLSNYGNPGGPAQGDLDGDGVIGLADLTTLLSAFGAPCG